MFTGRLLTLTSIFVLTEILAMYLLATRGGENPAEMAPISFILLVCIYLYSRRMNWAKWLLSVFLVIHAILYIALGVELHFIYYLLAAYSIFFAVYIHKAVVLSTSLSPVRNEMNDTPIQPVNTGSFVANEQTFYYPPLVKRIAATLIDFSAGFSVLIVLMVLFGDSGFRQPVMLATGAVFIFIYDPVLTAYARTLGQQVMKIRVVKHSNPNEPISLINAYVRIVIKALFGWLSFITINFNPEHRAIHDYLGGSVMVTGREIVGRKE